MKTTCLSHVLHNDLSCYNGEKNIKILPYKNNEKIISMPLHSGTHIDFPRHINSCGKDFCGYEISDFIFTNPYVLEIRCKDNYIKLSDIKDVPNDTDFLIFKVLNSPDRNSSDYAISNIGISEQTAIVLRSGLKNLKAVGINSISINAYKDKIPGKNAHKEFLGKKPEILIVEDMKLDDVKQGRLNRVLISPLLVHGADGVPVTVVAEVEE